MIKKTLSMLSIVFLMSSCGPFYRTEYEFIPPQTPSERSCANLCVRDKTNCIQKCNDRFVFEGLSESIMSVLGSKRQEPSSDEKRACEEVCNQGHRTCHENCGGKVIKRKICIYGCDKEKKNR